MTMTKLGGLGEIATAIAKHGLLTYIGTNRGNLYSMVNTTGVFTLLDSVGEKIVSMAIEHPTIYMSTNQGSIYSYAITVSGDAYAQFYQQASIKHHDHLTAGDYAYQLRTESTKATGDFFGMDLEVHQSVDKTAGAIRGLSMCGRLAATKSLTGDASLIAGYFLLDNDGTLNGTGLHAALVAKVDAGGTFTSVGHLASLWVDSLQSGPVSGSHQLIYMTNNGNCKLDQAFYLYGGTAAQGIAALFEFEACTGAQNFLSDKVDADIAFAHYRKVACTVDGVAGWLVLGLDA